MHMHVQQFVPYIFVVRVTVNVRVTVQLDSQCPIA